MALRLSGWHSLGVREVPPQLLAFGGLRCAGLREGLLWHQRRRREVWQTSKAVADGSGQPRMGGGERPKSPGNVWRRSAGQLLRTGGTLEHFAAYPALVLALERNAAGPGLRDLVVASARHSYDCSAF